MDGRTFSSQRLREQESETGCEEHVTLVFLFKITPSLFSKFAFAAASSSSFKCSSFLAAMPDPLGASGPSRRPADDAPPPSEEPASSSAGRAMSVSSSVPAHMTDLDSSVAGSTSDLTSSLASAVQDCAPLSAACARDLRNKDPDKRLSASQEISK